jgi:Uma2 family endonuclease
MATVTLPQQTGAERIAPPDDFLYEEIDGTIVEKLPTGAYAEELGWLLQALLIPCMQATGLGRVVTEVLFNLRPAVTRSRRPDVAFLSAERWPLDRRAPRKGAWPVVPELAVQIVSPSDGSLDVVKKLEEYFLAGSHRVWIVYPDVSKVYVYDAPSSVRIFARGDTLTDEILLPGFRLDLVEFFGPPDSEADADSADDD